MVNKAHKNISPEVHAEIMSRLSAVEQSRHVRVLFAVESGSRAWNMHSPNSDYDVRFIYVHEPSWYWSFKDGRDVIEDLDREADIDLSGWELRKAVRLMMKGNAVIQEWFRSDITYRTDTDFQREMLQLLSLIERRYALTNHFFNISKRIFRERVKDQPAPKLKAYLYTIRPLLQYLWVANQPEQFDHQVILPPISILQLVNENPVPDNVRQEILRLVEEKKAGSETSASLSRPILNSYIEDIIENPTGLNNKPSPAARLSKQAVQESDRFLTRWIMMETTSGSSPG
ncbi:nucleotidyltransferase domain-containing protein [Alphaproteobacteria bacterium HT1-32]|nr:nucleotidyltransferase domain-containing protein [Alphaproteobacteria bacterium HT1-32]